MPTKSPAGHQMHTCGGVYIYQSTADISDCTIRDNASPETGGGVYLDSSPTSTFETTIICANTPSQIDGGYNDNGGNVIRTNCDYWVVDDLFDDDPNADFDTIQAAVDAAIDGDEILVMPGTYFENVDIGGKSISLRAQGDFLNTKVNGGGQGAVLQSLSATGTTIQLSGLTLENGTGAEY